MWTLRDLWMMLNPDYEEEWRKKKMQQMFKGQPARDGSLSTMLQQRNATIDNNPKMHNWKPYTIEDYYQGMEFGVDKIQNPPYASKSL